MTTKKKGGAKVAVDPQPQSGASPEAAASSEADPAPPTANDFLRVLAQMSPSERVALSDSGIVVPTISNDPESDPTARKFGYRCRHCNKVALVFIGDRFTDAAGNQFDEFPGGIQPASIPWVQPRRAGNPGWTDRSRPNCQCCGEPVDLMNGLFRPERVVDISVFESSRDAATKGARRRARAQRTGSVSVPTAQGQVGLVDQVAPEWVDPTERQKISDQFDENGVGKAFFGESGR